MNPKERKLINDKILEHKKKIIHKNQILIIRKHTSTCNDNQIELEEDFQNYCKNMTIVEKVLNIFNRNSC